MASGSLDLLDLHGVGSLDLLDLHEVGRSNRFYQGPARVAVTSPMYNPIQLPRLGQLA